LGEEVAEPLGGLDCPGSVVSEPVGPVAQLDDLGRAGSDLEFVEDELETVDRDSGVGRLVRVDPDGDGHGNVPFSR